MVTKCIDISEWNKESYQPIVIGKREKYLCFTSKGKAIVPYYFKKPKSTYPWEFWLEVAASKIGQLLNFDVANYDVAYTTSGEVGCISESIFKPHEDLIHGQQYLLRIKPDFETRNGDDHTFQLIEKFFNEYPQTKPLLKDFIIMLVFDAVVGNHDRHQQNWAIVRTPLEYWSVQNIFYLIKKELRIVPNSYIFEPRIKLRFSKIFDSGNCLGHNYTEEKLISDLLGNANKFETYVGGNKAVGHLKWHADKLKYTDLLEKIKKHYPGYINIGLRKIKRNFNRGALENTINEMDREFPADLINSKYKLTSARKETIIKLVNRRIELLQPLF